MAVKDSGAIKAGDHSDHGMCTTWYMLGLWDGCAVAGPGASGFTWHPSPAEGPTPLNLLCINLPGVRGINQER